MNYKIQFHIIILILFNTISQNQSKNGEQDKNFHEALANRLKSTPSLVSGDPYKTVPLSSEEISSPEFAKGAEAANEGTITSGEKEYLTNIFNKEKNTYKYKQNSNEENLQQLVISISTKYNLNDGEHQFLIDLITKENQNIVLSQNSIWAKVGVICALIVAIVLFLKIKI